MRRNWSLNPCSQTEHKGPVQVTQVEEDKVMVLMDGKDAPPSFPHCPQLSEPQTLCLSETLSPSRPRPRPALFLTLNLLSSSSVTNLLSPSLKGLSLPTSRVSEAGDSRGGPSPGASDPGDPHDRSRGGCGYVQGWESLGSRGETQVIPKGNRHCFPPSNGRGTAPGLLEAWSAGVGPRL